MTRKNNGMNYFILFMVSTIIWIGVITLSFSAVLSTGNITILGYLLSVISSIAYGGIVTMFLQTT